MKIIISHDVDHMTALEHRSDLIVPKFIVRAMIECSLGYISPAEVMRRLKMTVANKWQNVPEVLAFDVSNGVAATFFVAVGNGRNLRYSLEGAERLVNTIHDGGLDAGVHGIAFDDADGINREYALFRRLSKSKTFGIRMHDIGIKKKSDTTVTGDNLALLEQAGYLFSSNTFDIGNPHRIGTMWEFPIGIMDGYIFNSNARWQSRTLQQAKEETERLLRHASHAGIRYFSILFHDFFFNDCFVTQKKWYMWLIDYCRREGHPFCDYREAVRDLERAEAAPDLRAAGCKGVPDGETGG